MGNFLPKYPKNYFKNQKGLRSFWKMISIGISIIFGILACIDKFEKQWELNVFYFGIALLLFYIFIHPVWMDAKKKKDTVTFFVEGMECANCQKKVEKNISFEKGVTDMKCDLTTRTVVVTYKPDKTSKTKLASAFKKIGMEAVPVDDGAGCPVDPAKKK